MNKEKEFDEIFNTYWYRLYAYCYNIVRNHDEAKEITRRIFSKLWNRFEIIEISQYKSYLYLAAKSECAKKLKFGDFNEEQLKSIDAVINMLPNSEDDLAMLRAKLLQDIEVKAGEILPEKCLKVFRLRFKERLTNKEISGRLNLSSTAVDSLLNKAVKLLHITDIQNELLIGLLMLSVI